MMDTCKRCKDYFDQKINLWIKRFLWNKIISGDNPFVLVNDGTFRRDILTIHVSSETYRRDDSRSKWIKESQDDSL